MIFHLKWSWCEIRYVLVASNGCLEFPNLVIPRSRVASPLAGLPACGWCVIQSGVIALVVAEAGGVWLRKESGGRTYDWSVARCCDVTPDAVAR